MKNKFSSTSFLILIFILIIIGIIAAFGKESYRKYQIDRDIAALEEKIEALENEKETLSQLLKYFNSDEALEKEARLKLNLLKEGEKLVIITPKNNSLIENGDEAEELGKTTFSNFKTWLKYLFDINPRN